MKKELKTKISPEVQYEADKRLANAIFISALMDWASGPKYRSKEVELWLETAEAELFSDGRAAQALQCIRNNPEGFRETILTESKKAHRH